LSRRHLAKKTTFTATSVFFLS